MSRSEPTGQVLSAAAVAAEYGIAEKTLANWRWQRRGPRFFKTSPGKGGAVRYRRADVEAWASAQTVQTAPG